MYSKLPAFVFGFHGCDITTKEAVLNGSLKYPDPSKNKYDWLGSGIYFWEQNPARAMEFAQKAHEHPNRYSRHVINTPAVLGAVIDLGYCMNLMDSIHIKRLSLAYDLLKAATNTVGTDMPTNHGKDENNDRPLRELDRSVIETLHEYIENNPGQFQRYDTVRGLFLEGGEVYPGAGFRVETHIQICVRNVNCIKAFFNPRTEVKNPYIV
jgi:hypothetical protein